MWPRFLRRLGRRRPAPALVVKDVRAGARDASQWVGAGALDVVWFDGDLERLDCELLARPRYSAVVDAAAGPQSVARLRRVVPRVELGGTLVVVKPGGAYERSRRTLDSLLAKVRELQAAGAVSAPHSKDRRDRHTRYAHATAASLRIEEETENVVRLTVVAQQTARLPETLADEVLARRPDLGTTLTTVPPGKHTSDAPALSLRAYRDACALPRQVVRTDDLVLPDSYRHPFRDRPASPVLADWSPVAVGPVEVEEPRRLDGAWFHLDSAMGQHFGHALTEVLGRMWGWPEAQERFPDLRAFVLGRGGLAEWEADLFEAAGVPRERLHAFPGPVRVGQLVCATPGYAIGEYVHPVLEPTYVECGRRLAARSSMTTPPERLFLTRSGENRPCRNHDEVEALVTEHGFEIVRPETLSLHDQVRLVESADTVAGYAGSGMFHLALTSGSKPVVAITSDTYHAHNEKQICAFRGHDLQLVRGKSEHVTQGFSSQSMHSAFAVDLAVVEDSLRRACRR